jgi:hypothetical protein
VDIIIPETISNIIIPAIISSDCPISELSDPFTVDIIPNSFPLLAKNKVSEKNDPFEHLELFLNKRYAIWRRKMIEYWNPWWRQVLSSSETDSKFGYFVWLKAKRSAVWEYFDQGTDIQNGSPKALCKACWKVFAHPELRTGGSSISTFRCYAEYKKYGGSKSHQGLLSQFRAMVSK